MRWRLLVVTSIAAALLGCILWCVLTIAFFGSARILAQNDWLLFGSALLPLAFALFAGVFVYRHTARKRKTQAVIAALLSILLTPVGYLAAWSLLPDRLYIPTTYDVRHSR